MTSEAILIKLAGSCLIALFLGAIGAYVRYLRQSAPLPSANGEDISSPAAIARFRTLDMRANGVFVCLTIALGAGMYYLLRGAATLEVASMQPAQLTYPAADAFWTVIALFAGIGIASTLVVPLMMRWWPADTRWYTTYLSIRRYQCDYERLCRGLGIAFALGAISFVPFALNWYTQVRGDAFVVHPLFGFHEVKTSLRGHHADRYSACGHGAQWPEKA